MNRIATLNFLAEQQARLSAKFPDKGCKEYKRAEVMIKAGHVALEVQQSFSQMYKLSNGALQHEENAEPILQKLFIEGFQDWNKDELLTLVANINTSQVLDTLKG